MALRSLCSVRIAATRYGQRALSSPKTSLSTSASLSSNDSTQETVGEGKLYELRTYAIKPDVFGEFMKIMQTGYALRTAHSKLCGYWSTDLGGVNEVVHIWEYGCPSISIMRPVDNYAHRAQVRKALSQDKNWIDNCFSKILPMFQLQTNVVMRGFSWYPPQLDRRTGQTGVYELVSYEIKPGMVPQFEHRLRQDFDEITYNPLGLWYSIFGDVHRVYSLFRYSSLDQREDLISNLMEKRVVEETVKDLDTYLNGTVRKILTPTTFSTLQ